MPGQFLVARCDVDGHLLQNGIRHCEGVTVETSSEAFGDSQSKAQEQLRVHAKTGNWFYIDSLDTIHRRGGGLRTDKQRERAENRVDILRDAFLDRKAGFTGLLQINKIPIEQLEQNSTAKISVRVKDEDRWYVASWDERRQRAIVVRARSDWATLDEIDGAANPESAPPEEPPALNPEDQPKLVFPDQEHRDKVETASMEFVTTEYERCGFKVDDVSPQNRGFDLLVRDKEGRTVEYVEVKGTSMATPAFFLTRNEFLRAQGLPTWRLAIVTSALHARALKVLPAQEMFDSFGFDPLVYRCTPRLQGDLSEEERAPE
jgi:hypothetical protein